MVAYPRHPSNDMYSTEIDWQGALSAFQRAVAFEEQHRGTSDVWASARRQANRVNEIIVDEENEAIRRAAARIRAEGLNDETPFADALETGDWSLIAI